MLGYLLLSLLTLYAFTAAVFVAVRLRYGSRAEALLVATILWNFIILVPIHLLGLTNALYPGRLGWASFAASSAVIAASFVRTGSPTAHLDAARRLALGLARLPLEAVATTFRARSLVFVGLAAVALILPWTAWMTYLAPSDSWDGIWYHETMIGYAIQNHGYGTALLPMNLTQQANGYPRNCEMTGLWFVIFTGRKLVELPSTLAAFPLLLSTFLIARRYLTDRIPALGWACGLLLMPGALLELRSTYIDLHVAAFLMSALHFCTRPKMRVRDGWVAGVALALLIGSKSIALVWVPLLAVVALTQLVFRHARHRTLAVIGATVGGIGLIVGVAAVTYLHNWFAFKNPLWPIGYTNPRFHIQWPGVTPFDALEAAMDSGRTLKDIYLQMLSVPVPGKDFADTRVWGYGLAVPFLLIPLGALAFGVALFSSARLAVRSLLGIPLDAEAAGTLNLLTVSLLLLAMAYISPALWQARYNIHLAAGLMFLVNWLSGRGPLRRLAEGATAVTILTGLIMLWWADPGWGLGVKGTLNLSNAPASVRATLPPAEWSIAPEVAAARERQLGPGSVVVFTDDITFPSLLWNEQYSNTVLYTPPAPPDQMLARLEQLRAQWAVAGASSPLYSALTSHPELWERVGLASRGYPTTAFRRHW